MRRVNFCCFIHWCSSPGTQNNAWHILGTQYLLNEWTQGSQATQESVPRKGKRMSAPRSRWWQWPWEGFDPGSSACGDPVWAWQVSCQVKWGLSQTRFRWGTVCASRSLSVLRLVRAPLLLRHLVQKGLEWGRRRSLDAERPSWKRAGLDSV